jgi:hypothetical protein
VPESSVIESPSTPLNLSTLSKSVNEIGSSSLTLTSDSKRGKKGILILMLIALHLLRMSYGLARAALPLLILMQI